MRTGWLSLTTKALAIGFLTGRHRLIKWIVVSCLAIGSGILALPELGYQRATADPSNLLVRVSAWNLGLNEIKAHPVLGVGYGNNTFLMRLAGTEEFKKQFGGNPETSSGVGPHNLFLMVAMGSGVPALILLLWVIVQTLHSLLRRRRSRVSSSDEALLLGAALMVFGFAVTNFFDSLLTGSLAYLFWIILATALPRQVTAKEAR